MYKVFLSIYLILGIALGGYAQNFQYHYQILKVDSTLDAKVNPKLQKYLNAQHDKLSRELGEVIGFCETTLNSYDPASPLSNLLTDILRQQAPSYAGEAAIDHCDIAILNFGGIRSQLSAGDITIGDIYAISPFENLITYIEIKGAELRKALIRFREHGFNAAFSGAQITYISGLPSQIKIQGEPLKLDKTYMLVTINFIAEGGDDILKDIHYESTWLSNTTFRDFLIEEIKNITKSGNSITSQLDDRVIINPTR